MYTVMALVALLLVIIKTHSNVLRRNYSMNEIPEDGINGCRNASVWKIVCDY